MKLRHTATALLTAGLCLFSCSCGPALLERDYHTSTPHTSRYWESEAANTLRAENYQEIVNDLLLLVSRHTESAMLRLYGYKNDWQVTNALEHAIVEVRTETPLGAYAVEYITASSQAQRGYYEIPLQIEYRRTASQIQSVKNASSPDAVYSLLTAMLSEGTDELAVRIGYWSNDGKDVIRSAIAQVREETGLEEEEAWGVYYYPDPEHTGLVEILRHPPEPYIDPDLPEEVSANPEIPEEGNEPDSEGVEAAPESNRTATEAVSLES